MKIQKLLLFLFCVFSSSASPVPEIPSFLKTCHRSDPHLSDCIKQSINLLKPYLRNGIPQLHVPPCDPLHLDNIEIDQCSGPIYVRANYKNVSIYGGTNIVTKTIKLDFDKNRMRLKLHIPRFEMTFNYNLDGKIMMLPIKGNGTGHGNFTNIDAILTLQMERYTNQHTQLLHQRIVDIYVDFDIGYAAVHLDNLFGGETTMSSAMNLFLNHNWRTVVAEIKPKLEETIGELIKNFMNNIFAVFPEDVLLPP
ncbi:protein takeout [Megachile rotundata]|uniref:protein takeout n=1 Tax=Megachile rotundata TaxID=143995 RepID=UPI003FD33784